jgi:hypothetical protein
MRRRRVQGGRHHRHVVRVTPEEEARLLMLAGEYKVSVAKLLVDSALAAGAREGAVTAAPAAPAVGVVDRAVAVELFAAVRQLAGIATNVNQIARKANTTGELAAETPATLAAVRDCAARIEAVLGRMSVAGS